MDAVIPPHLTRLQKAKDPELPLQAVFRNLKSLMSRNLGIHSR